MFTIREIPGACLGVEVVGSFDLRSASAADVAAAVDAMHRRGRGVLVFRDQHLTPADLESACAKLAAHFVGQQPYTRWPGQSKPIPGCPHLALLGNYEARRDGEFGMDVVRGETIGEFKPATDAIEEWHTDGSFLENPKVAIALYAPQVPDALPPPGAGGETRFASCAAAFEKMSDAEKEDAEALDAVHSWELFMRLLERRDPDRPKVTAEEIAAKPDQTWPLVRRHPVTGAKSVYVSPKNTRAVVRRDSGARLAPDAAKTLVETLGRRVVDSGVYAHEWRRGDFVIWDNRVLLHAASPFDAEAHQRLLFRMEFKGEPVLGP